MTGLILVIMILSLLFDVSNNYFASLVSTKKFYKSL